MALRLEFPLISCNSLSHLLQRRPNTLLLYLSESSSHPAIPGSHWLPLTALRDADAFFTALEGLETAETAVVCYEDEGLAQAAGAWWLLVSRGRRLVYVLEGGLQRWTQSTGPETGNSPDSALLKPFSEPLLPRPVTQSQQQVTTDVDISSKLYIDPSLLLHGSDLADPNELKLRLSEAGIQLDDACETIVYGSKAPLLLLTLCSLGKNSLRLGVDIPLDMQLYGEDDYSTGLKRQLSNLSEPEQHQSTRSSLAPSLPTFCTRDVTMPPRKRTHDFSGRMSCRSCLLQ